MTTTVERQAPEAAAEALTGRLFGEGVGAFHLLCVHIGSKLGLYRALGEGAPLTAAELADRLGLDRWYVREWLQAEATAGLVTVDGDVDSGHFALAPGAREALVEKQTRSTSAGSGPRSRRPERPYPGSLRRSARVRECPTPTTAPTPSRHRPRSTVQHSPTPWLPSGWPACPMSRRG